MSKRKAILLSIVVIFLGFIITSASYAFWSWLSDSNKSVAFNTSKALRNYIVYDEGESKFVGDFKAGSNYQDNSVHSTISLYKTEEAANVSLMATIHMDINSIGNNIKNSNALKWVVTEGTSTVIAQGNFIGANNRDTLTLVPNIEVTTTNKEYTIWIWLDRNANPGDSLTGETLDTNVWTEINQLEGIEDIFEITGTRVTHQNVNATVVNSKYKVTSYAIVTKGTTPSSWTTIIPSSIYNLNTTVSETGEYDIYFKDEHNRTIHESINVTSIVTTPPTCTFGSWSRTPISNNETSNIELTCIDEVADITVNTLRASDITLSNSNVTISNINKTSITNGYKYTITVKGTTNDGTTTLTLPINKIKNEVGYGNVAITSAEITVANTYTVRFHRDSVEYQEVEYIESTGTQYIDTGVIPTATTAIFLDLKVNTAGAMGSSGAASYKTIFDWRNSKLVIKYTSNEKSVTLTPDSNRHVYFIDYRNLKAGYDSTEVTLTENLSFGSITFWLNQWHEGNNGYYGGSYKYYNVKIYNGDNLVRNFIPCYRINDNVIGLYDTVNSVFYPNSGTGAFTKGNDVTTSSAFYTQTLTYNVSEKLAKNKYLKNGYTFDKWNTKADGTGTSYNDEQEVLNLTSESNGVFDLYAQWNINTYYVKFTSNNELCNLAPAIYSDKSVEYEDDININNPICEGFAFDGWTSSTISGWAKSGTTASPTTAWNGSLTKNTYFKNLVGSGNATLVANWTKTDNTAPTLTLGTSESGNTYTKQKTATITFSDNVLLRAGTYTIKYGWSTSNLTCNDLTATTTISVVEGESTKTIQITIDGYTGAGKLYICNQDILYDRVGNQINANTLKSTNMYLDNSAPTATLTLSTVTSSGAVTVRAALSSISDLGSGILTPYYYKMSTDSTCESTSTGFIESTATNYTFMGVIDTPGTYYVCVKLQDKLGNASYLSQSIEIKAYLRDLSNGSTYFKESAYKTKITKVKFVDYIDTSNAISGKDPYILDEYNSGMIKGWLERNTDGADTYDLYIGSDSTIYGKTFRSLFDGMTGITSITFNNIDTSEVTSMYHTFANCNNLTTLDVTGFNTSNVTNMEAMFSNCKALTTLDVTHFNTQNVQYMTDMFNGCSALTSLDVTYFNTQNVKNMAGMFKSNSGLTSLNVSNFNTSNVTNMSSMFNGCKNLTNLNVTNFNTSNVTNMAAMFKDCSTLTSLNVSSFNTSNVTTMGGRLNGMFEGCSGLTTLDLSNFDTSNVTDMTSMFADCKNLTSINLSSFNTSKLTTVTANVAGSMRGMFFGCSSLLSLNLSSFDTSKIVNFAGFFQGCSSLTTLDLGNFDTSSATIMNNMFRDCSSLTSINLSSFNTSNVTDMSSMFYGCSSFASLNLSNFNTSSVTDFANMFYACTGLTSLDLGNFNTSNATNMANMFNGCHSLTSLNVTSFDTSNVTNMWRMLSGLLVITSIDISSFNTSNVTDMNQMFRDDKALTTIYVSDRWNTDAVTDSNEMFVYSTKIVGGAGTEYNGTTDKTYARVDNPPDSPGYLTYKAYTPPSPSSGS